MNKKEKRVYGVTVPLNYEELDKLRQLAKKYGISISELIRMRTIYGIKGEK